jgi:hypothetical protein
MEIKFDYPAPITKPRPVGAKLFPIVQINTDAHIVAGQYQEFLENATAGEPPVLSPDMKPFVVTLTEEQLQQILGVIMVPAQQQGALVAGSTPVAPPAPVAPTTTPETPPAAPVEPPPATP